MLTTPVSVPELDELAHAITLGVSPEAWEVIAGLAGELDRTDHRTRRKLYLRHHDGVVEVQLVDSGCLLLVRPAIVVQDGSPGDFSAELDPQIFTGSAPEGAALTVTPTSPRNVFTVSTVDRSETVSVTTGWLPPSWDHLTARVSDRTVTCSTPTLRDALREATAGGTGPVAGTVTLHSEGLTVEAWSSGHRVDVPTAPRLHPGTFSVDLDRFRLLVEHTTDDNLAVLVPGDGWGVLAVRSDRTFGVVEIQDPFPQERSQLGALLTEAVAPLPMDNLGRYFVGVPAASTRINVDLTATAVGDDPTSVQIRLRLDADDTIETRLDLAAATPTTLQAAIEHLSNVAIERTPLAQRVGLDAPAHLAHFREHLTLDQCNKLLHYSHVIPITKGFTAAYVADHFPGWTWNELVKVFVAAGIFVNRGGAPATCDKRVVSFHFSSPTEFHVEWVGGTEPGDVAAKRRANDITQGQYTIDAGNGVTIATLGGVDPDEH
jgi:hypothetical protein